MARTSLILAATVGLAGIVWSVAGEIQPRSELLPASLAAQQVIDPARVEGHEKCIDCHKTELQAWLKTKHATRAFDLLRTAPTAREYAEKLNIRPADIARNSLCVQCHATPQIRPSGHLGVLAGVSCEQCHNASGGRNGWLNIHAVYGNFGTRREQETETHYQRRVEACRQAGQRRSDRIYDLAKRCFQCHVVSQEALAKVGHDHGEGFELTERMLGEVRHNFLLNPHFNAEAATLWTDPMRHGEGRSAAGRKRVVFIVGQLVDLEVSLSALASATEESDFTDLLIGRIEDAFELVAEDLIEELENTSLPEIEQVIQVVEPIVEKLDDDGFSPDDKQLYVDTANKIASVAKEFSKRDGSKLSEIDALDLLPEGPYKNVYQPK